MTANDRAFDLLRAVVAAPSPQGLGELVVSSGLTKPTVRRLLVALDRLGFVRQDAKRRYVAGAGILDLAAAALERIDLAGEAQEVLAGLRTTMAGTVALSEYVDGRLVVVSTLAPNGPYKVAGRGVTNTGLHATATGKAVLAFLPAADTVWLLGNNPLERYTEHTLADITALRGQLREIAGLGFAINDQESRAGVRCIAAPVRNHLARPVAVVSVSVAAAQVSVAALCKHSAQLMEAADAISDGIGGPRLGNCVAGGSESGESDQR
ncbi:IclR family transcriptional regulator [Nocardia sp. CWNU-33]|uniref:IclR family transcriptional regulator n=1 Tax=Nocardia sp. CWNU-33 TaxID=3392117 RepID=UPI00398F1F42